MLLTGHESRAIFDRYNIININEQELLDAGDQLVEYLAQQAQAVPARRRPHSAGPTEPPSQEAGRHPPPQPPHKVLPLGIDRLGANPADQARTVRIGEVGLGRAGQAGPGA